MDIKINEVKYLVVRCAKCRDTHVVYNDIHKNAWHCPTCFYSNGVLWKHWKGGTYRVGNVPKHVSDEEFYDHDWANFIPEIPEGDEMFDQDDDFINANLGWD